MKQECNLLDERDIINIMESVIDVLETLESDNSRNFKEELLRKHRDNELLKKIFIAVADPYSNYFVKKWKTPQPLENPAASDNKQIKAFLDLLSLFSSRSIVGNEARSSVEAVFQLMDKRQQKWCTRILLRNLRVGVSESLVDKTWPGSVSKFSVQLAETLSSTHDPKKGIVITDIIDYPARVEPKLDGLRCITIKHLGAVTMFTRSGSQIETLPKIRIALEAADYDDFVLDGEIMGETWNDTASVMMSHKSNKDDENMVYHVFDAVNFEDWRSQHNETKLEERIELVNSLVTKINSKRVIQVAGKTVNSQNKLMTFYSETLQKGYEGVMVKSLTSSYHFKRTDAVRKLKPVTTYEGVVVGNYEGTRGSKREGLWGGFLVLMPNGIVTRCGGGFNDKIRAEISLDPDSWIGKVLEIEGQPDPLTTDGLTQDGKVRFPVFVKERNKNDVDSKVLEAYQNWKKDQF